MNSAITIHDKNGTDAVTVTPEFLIEQLLAYNVLDPFKALVNSLDALSATKGQTGIGRDMAEQAYKTSIAECRRLLNPAPAPAPVDYKKPISEPKDATVCRSCGAKIVWFTTAKNAKIPVDLATVVGNVRLFDADIHTSHFATCPNAQKHRNTAPKKTFNRPKGVTAEAQAALFYK